MLVVLLYTNNIKTHSYSKFVFLSFIVSTPFCPQLNRMRRFLQDPEVAFGSGIPQPECDDGCIEVEELDNEVQETASDVEPMIADQSSSTFKSATGPWPYIKKHYKFKSNKDSKLKFQCLLCLPATKLVVCTLKSEMVKAIVSDYTLYDFKNLKIARRGEAKEQKNEHMVKKLL